jgi:hypothetical protein
MWLNVFQCVCKCPEEAKRIEEAYLTIVFVILLATLLFTSQKKGGGGRVLFGKKA